MDLLANTLTRVLSAPSTFYDALIKPMDTIFNIPLLSVLLLPSLSSWSTSFNVLFFYATWSLLLLSQPPLAVEFLGTLLIRLVFFAVPSAVFLALDGALPFLMRQLKQHGDRGIATSAWNGGAGPGGRWWRVVLLAAFNIVLGVSLQTAVDWVLTGVFRTRSALVIATALPMPWAIIKNLAAAYALRELVGYAAHRYVLHASDHGDPTGAPAICRYAAERHRLYYHRLHTPLPFSAHFDHPLPYLVRVWLPAYLPAAALRMHLLTYHLWLALIGVEEALVHSNYAALPTGLVFGGMARRVERHLRHAGHGAYGVYGILDLLAGTTLADDDGPAHAEGDDPIDDVLQEARRRDLPERARRKARLVTDRARDLGDDLHDGARRELRQRRARPTRPQS